MSGFVGGAGSKSGVIGTTELDYEEGTWTPKLNGNDKGISGLYTKIGNYVHCQMWLWANTTGDEASCKISTLPFTSLRNQHFFFNRVRGGDAEYMWGVVNDGGNEIGLMTEGTTSWSNYTSAHANWTYTAGGSSIIAWNFSYVTGG